jgi:hypothetical protein
MVAVIAIDMALHFLRSDSSLRRNDKSLFDQRFSGSSFFGG